MTNTIYSAPSKYSEEQLSQDPVLRFFHYSHLSPRLQEVSRPFFVLAAAIVNLCPRNAERSVALRKLLEAKDAAVRSRV